MIRVRLANYGGWAGMMLLGCWACAGLWAEERVWTRADGGKTVTAVLLRIHNGKFEMSRGGKQFVVDPAVFKGSEVSAAVGRHVSAVALEDLKKRFIVLKGDATAVLIETTMRRVERKVMRIPEDGVCLIAHDGEIMALRIDTKYVLAGEVIRGRFYRDGEYRFVNKSDKEQILTQLRLVKSRTEDKESLTRENLKSCTDSSAIWMALGTVETEAYREMIRQQEAARRAKRAQELKEKLAVMKETAAKSRELQFELAETELEIANAALEATDRGLADGDISDVKKELLQAERLSLLKKIQMITIKLAELKKTP